MTTTTSVPTAWQQWRHDRDAEFADPYGWLSLTARTWLGSEPTAVPGAPGQWWVAEDGFHVEVPDGASLAVDGVPVVGRALLWQGRGAAPDVTAGERRLELLVRGLGLRGVRVRDPHSPALLAFAGVPAFDYDPVWRITGRWHPYDAAREVSVVSVLPGVRYPQQVVGEISFEVAGQSYRLAVNDGDWIAFRDASNGVQTNSRCRWVDVAVQADGTAVVDFNLSANPPCAFTDFGTCPLPPEGNDLPVAVLAGERDPRPGH